MYNPYKLEANTSSENIFEMPIKIFRSFLNSENISKGSVRSYVSDVRHFLNWLLFFLEANHIKIQNIASPHFPPSSLDPHLTSHPHPAAFLKHINSKVLGSYKDYLTNNNIPLKTINRRFSSLRRFGIFCKIQVWSSSNVFDTLKNISLNQPFPENKYHLAEYRADLWKKGSSRSTIKNYLNDVKQFLSWVDSRGSVNPQ